MKSYRVYQIDAFTTEKFKGNAAGVVPEADGLSDDSMQEASEKHHRCNSGCFASIHRSFSGHRHRRAEIGRKPGRWPQSSRRRPGLQTHVPRLLAYPEQRLHDAAVHRVDLPVAVDVVLVEV